MLRCVVLEGQFSWHIIQTDIKIPLHWCLRQMNSDIGSVSEGLNTFSKELA